jgi:hypothetical protein
MYTKYIAYTRRTSVWGQDDVRIKQVFSPTNFTTIQHAALHLPPLGFGTSLCETPTNSTLLRKEGEENTPHGAGTTRRQLRTDLHSTQGMIPSTSQDGFPTGKGIDHHITTSNLRNSNENGNHRHLWRDGLNLEESSVARDIAIVTLNPTEACSIETQAQNAIEFNRLYSTENGPRIKYLLFTMFCPDPWVGCNLVIPKEDITVILMRPRYLEYLVDAEMPINDDEGKRFLSIDSFSNQTANTTTNSDEDWSFNVTFLPTIVYPDQKIDFIYIMIAVVLALPIMHVFYLFMFVNRRVVVRRNQRGWITGLTLEIVYSYDNDDFAFPFSMDWKNTLVIHEVERLPLVKYNITKLEECIKQYCLDNYFDEVGFTGIENESESELESQFSADLANGLIDIEENSKEEKETDVCKRRIEQRCKFLQTAYTSCTICSVCLADFDHGEEIRLLPRCGHMFHHECLLPWVTERKNSCPLCQEQVIKIQQINPYDDSNSLIALNDSASNSW